MRLVTNLNLRPGTLAEAVQRYKSGHQKFSAALSEFLDEFYKDAGIESRYARARMPHDERWRAYEYLRTGLMPEDDDELPMSGAI
jgi:hypothetical protein